MTQRSQGWGRLCCRTGTFARKMTKAEIEGPLFPYKARGILTRNSDGRLTGSSIACGWETQLL